MSLHQKLTKCIRGELEELGKWSEELEVEIPKKWEWVAAEGRHPLTEIQPEFRHGNLFLFPQASFRSTIWRDLGNEFWCKVCKVIGAEKLARKVGAIKNDEFRSPSVELIYGADGLVSKLENGIRFEWDLTKCMFSSGNISEKQRISSWNCEGQTVVDLYAGIGYFTLSYLVHAKADFVYACEWNPDSLKALERNLQLNNVQNRCQILSGDNKITAPRNVAQHVNLGLVPSSENSWRTACLALDKSTGGILHIHGTIDLKASNIPQNSSLDSTIDLKSSHVNHHPSWIQWSSNTATKIGNLFKEEYPNETWIIKIMSIHRVKSFGPKVDHLIVDIKCIPNIN